jgi:hypothetical protein
MPAPARKGETLIEVIAALTALVIAGLAAVTVVISVLSSTAISKEFLIAQNLAREGIEGVTNIRDTNWLLFPTKKEDCWMLIDATDCAPADTVAAQDQGYVMMRDPSGKLYLKEKDTWLDLGDVGEDTADEEYKLYLNTSGYYTHSNADQADPQPGPVFYRMIEFEKADVLDDLVAFEHERVKATITVEWFNKSMAKTYTLSSILTNYEK